MIVKIEQLQALAALAPEKKNSQSSPSLALSSAIRTKMDVSAYLTSHGYDHRNEPCDGGQKHILRVCPLCADPGDHPHHKEYKTFVIQFSNGGIAAGCKSPRHAQKKWCDFRDAIERKCQVPGCPGMDWRAQETAANTYPYAIENGHFVYQHMTYDEELKKPVMTSERLCNFTSRIKEAVVKHYGEGDPAREYIIDGRLEDGRVLKTVKIPVADYSTMAWVRKFWDHAYIEVRPAANNHVQVATLKTFARLRGTEYLCSFRMAGR